ncbi:MAG: transposase [Pseudomonadota bacterium]
MEKHTELLKRLVLGRKRDGRCTYDAEAKLELIRACLKPGVSIARLAMQHGVNANLLRTWVVRYQREHSGNAVPSKSEDKPESTGAFTAVQIEAAYEDGLPLNTHPVINSSRNADAEPELSSMVPLQVAKANLSIRLHVQLPNGVGFDIGEAGVDTLLPIMEMLSQLPCSDSTTR